MRSSCCGFITSKYRSRGFDVIECPKCGQAVRSPVDPLTSEPSQTIMEIRLARGQPWIVPRFDEDPE